jgi:hypothetical protein
VPCSHARGGCGAATPFLPGTEVPSGSRTATASPAAPSALKSTQRSGSGRGLGRAAPRPTADPRPICRAPGLRGSVAATFPPGPAGKSGPPAGHAAPREVEEENGQQNPTLGARRSWESRSGAATPGRCAGMRRTPPARCQRPSGGARRARAGVGEAAGGGREGNRGAATGSPGAAGRRDPHPAGLSWSLPAEKLRAPPGLSRPLASGARKRPHIAGGPGAPDFPPPSSPAFVSGFFGGGNLCGVWASAAPAEGRTGELTAAQRRAGSAEDRFAAVAAVAMAKPAGLRPGPGK